MSALVLPFARPGSGASDKKAKDARSESEVHRRAHIKGVRESLSLRTGKVKLQRKLQRDEDAVLLARRLGADLERVKTQGRGALSRTLGRSGIKLNERARYALFTGDGLSEKRIRKLHRYVQLSDAIAAALEQDADLFLYEKLYGLRLMDSEIPRDDEAAGLSFLLDQMVKAVAEQTELGAFFDLAARTPGTMDAWGHFKSSSMTILRDRRHEDGFDHWTESQPIPSVPICRIFEQSFSGQARTAPWSKLGAKNPSELAEAVDGPTAHEVTDFSVEIWREIGLAIGERTQQGAIGPMFSGKAYIKVSMDGVEATPFYSWTLEHFSSNQPVILFDGSRWTACRAELELGDTFSDCWVEPSPPPGEPNYAVEHYYFSKHPVNVWNLRHLLDRSEHDEPAAESLLPEVSPETGVGIYRFSGEIGRRFEVALATGELERALVIEINRLKDELRRYLSERHVTLVAQDEEMMARWRAIERATPSIAEDD